MSGPPPATGPPLEIAFITSEMAPFAKTGGLADVSAALPRALARLGHRVTVFLPRYARIAFPPGEFAGSVHVPVDSVHRSAGFYRRPLEEGLEVVFLEHPPFFDRPELYGHGNDDYADNRLRFAFLARAALEYLRSRGLRPDVLHAHDWQAGMVPVYLKAFYWDDPALRRSPAVFTIHNLAYQGNFGTDSLDVLGLPWHLGALEAMGHRGGISYMKAGIQFAEMVNTVSPQYAREIQGPEMGYGLDDVLRARGGDLVGILNGVDYGEWDPRHDRHLAARYSPEELSGKAECKADLLRAAGLPAQPDLPLVGITSRLVSQKGFDYVAASWHDLLQRPLRMVVLGTGEPAVEQAFRSLAERAPDRFSVRLAYDEALAHKIQAGSDMFLMPSRYEPCGLTQMYALRYGTVPVVRATGGLVDTVEPWDPATGRGTGFRFDTPDGTGLMWAIDQALAAREDAAGWEVLMRNGMARDFSWDRSAQQYVEVYRRAMAMV
ncbi:MAG TPA: glycogen synthase GlgA [Vicinamibacteria bacterium]|nr:glycogen synthase GlgA [Vicinamibacteria bacterium]